MNIFQWCRKRQKQMRALAGDLEARYENYWTNLTTILLIIAIWWLVTIAKVSVQNLQTIKGLSQEERLTLAVLVFPLGWLLLSLAKPLPQSSLIGLALVIACGVYLYIVCDPPSLISNPDQQLIAKEFANQWHWTATVAAVVMFFIAVRTLNAVFRNQRVKLRQYWYWFISNMIAITIGYRVHSVVGLIAALILPNIRREWLSSVGDEEIVLRGRRLRNPARGGYEYRQILRSEFESFHAATIDLPLSEAKQHIFIVGTTGSGKTTILNRIMADILTTINKSNRRKAIVFDAKRAGPSILYGIMKNSPDVEIHILNPLDARASALDIAADIQSFTDIEVFCNTVLPPPSANERIEKFWRDNPLQLLRGVVEFFYLTAPGAFTFRDIINAFGSVDLLIGMLSSHPQTRYAIGLLGSDNTNQNLFSSVRTEIYKWRILAARWEHATKKISLKDWALKGGSILVLGKDVVQTQNVGTSTAILNSYILTRVSQLLLTQPDQPEPTTFLFLDELHKIRIDALEDLATQIRSKGGCIFAAVQSIQSLHQFYGDAGTSTILDQFRTKIGLRLESNETPAWFSKLAGDYEVKRAQASYEWLDDGNNQGHGKRTSIQQQQSVQPVILTSELNTLPVVSKQNGLRGFFLGRELFKFHYTWKNLSELFITPDTTQDDFVPVPADWEILKPWDDKDYARLNLTAVMRQIQKQQLEKQSKTLNGAQANVLPQQTEEDEILLSVPAFEPLDFESDDTELVTDIEPPDLMPGSTQQKPRSVPKARIRKGDRSPKQPKRNSIFRGRDHKSPPGR
ncbi:MAG: type IV secretion system DNA-binding domain-containing protein [Brasilonema octagenarum HA4186-MV1]|jgi:hypothetical protein|nr:type IV secretion system DNA-binding domain-containing protein [Brasilonema octagenarum HA4186-MV1]